MCIAIYNESGILDQKTFSNCWENNPDGGGLAYFDQGGKLQIVKELDSKETFYELYKQAREENPEAPMLVHFRIATHGKVDLDNCHPHKIDNDNVFIHNGMLGGYNPPANATHSDTVEFKINVLQAIEMSYNQTVQVLLEEIIGGGNKLCILNRQGYLMICNEHLGEWHEGNWYSNASYKREPFATSNHGTAIGFNTGYELPQSEAEAMNEAFMYGETHYWWNNQWREVEHSGEGDFELYTPDATEKVYLQMHGKEKRFGDLDRLEMADFMFSYWDIEPSAEDEAAIVQIVSDELYDVEQSKVLDAVSTF
jgi:predicted glutamine amidotransferase